MTELCNEVYGSGMILGLRLMLFYQDRQSALLQSHTYRGFLAVVLVPVNVLTCVLTLTENDAPWTRSRACLYEINLVE